MTLNPMNQTTSTNPILPAISSSEQRLQHFDTGRVPHPLPRSLRKWEGKYAALTALLAALALLPLAGCKKEAVPEPLVTVAAEQPVQGAISEKIVADAVLAPLAQAAIQPKISAPVRKFLVDRGSRVKAGQLLAILENADLSAAVLDNKGSYQAAKAAYDTATKAQVPEDTLRAESDFAQAKANLDLNRSIVKARKQLFAQGAIPGRDLDTAQAALVQAQAAYDAANKHLDSMRRVSRDAALKSARGQLDSASGKYNGAQASLAYSEIRSPIAGVVTDRPLFAGETAQAGAALITVMDTSAVIAKAHIAQAAAQLLKVGGDASLRVPGLPDPVPAKIVLISPALDTSSTTVEIWIKADNKAGTLKVGTPVKAVITGRTVPEAWKIPSVAVLSAQDGSKSVLVAGSDGAAHRKPVTLGITDGESVQVLSGLVPSDTVITTGAYGLEEGTKIKIGKPGEDDVPNAHGTGGHD
jgi:multidrug efflux pump subunit AcrA (membrane-fusion protein)